MTRLQTALSPPNTIKQADSTARREQMHQLVQAGLKKMQREARIMHGIGEAMRPVLSVKSIIDSAIQAAPHTALPWAGVCIALQVRRRQETASVDNSPL